MKIHVVFSFLCACFVAATASTQAVTITVTNTADSGAGSLRASLAAATNGDTIDATGVSGTITLTTGELLVDKSVTILGPGPDNLAINGNATTRAFHVTNAVTVAISGLTVTNGNAVGGFPGNSGGGIWNDHSTLTVSNCAITANSAASFGGGLFNDGRLSGAATLTVIVSTIHSNAQGGIFNDGDSGGNATLTLIASTLSSNSSAGGGGGIYSYGDGGSATGYIVASTLSGNSATGGGVGGGIWNDGGPGGSASLFINASTFAGNTALNGGGGVFVNAPGGGTATLDIGDTILKNGAFGANIASGFQGTTITSHGYNLSSDNAGFLLNDPTDQMNVDPVLGPLANNGGPTLTHAPLSGSPAIDKGKLDAIPSLARNTDQRGVPRPLGSPAVAGGDGSDIGVFELIPQARFISIAALTDNSIELDGTGLSNLTYTIQANSNLNTTNWTVIGTAPADGSGVFSFTDTNARSFPRRFYRALPP